MSVMDKKIVFFLGYVKIKKKHMIKRKENMSKEHEYMQKLMQNAEVWSELQKELPQPLLNQSQFYHNAFKDNKDIQSFVNKQSGYVCVYPDFIVKDEDVPPAFKSMGIQFNRACRFYALKYDEKSHRFCIVDEQGNYFSDNRLHGRADKKSVTMVTDVFGMEASDYKRLMYLRNLKKKGISVEVFEKLLSSKDKSLLKVADLVETEIVKAERGMPSAFHHEVKHIKNRWMENKRDTAPDRGKLNAENYYRLCEYDEKSATLSELTRAIGLYVSKADLNDFSMFTEKQQWLVEKLKSKPEAYRRKMLLDKKMIVQGCFEKWDESVKQHYMTGQFKRKVASWATETPVSYYGDDQQEYLKRRSDMLSIPMVNPVTGKLERIDFSQYIEQDIQITPEMKKNIIEPAEKIIKKRKNKLNLLGITRSIVGYVQKLHWKNCLRLSQNGQGGNGR